MAQVLIRTDPITVQLLYRGVGTDMECSIVVGHGAQQSYIMGPYKNQRLSISEAIQMVVVDQRLQKTNDLFGYIDSTVDKALKGGWYGNR